MQDFSVTSDNQRFLMDTFLKLLTAARISQYNDKKPAITIPD